MTTVRSPAVAGTFYPENPTQLQVMVRDMLAQAALADSSPKAVIVPHAGYVYSGPVAASAYKQLAAVSEQVQRIVLLGPSHRVPLFGLALSSADFFETPLGVIPLDQSTIERLSGLPQARVMDQAHAMEHSLEVQLPFLQEILDSFSLVPIVVGDASAEQVAEVIDALWGGDETRFVISSDLSHYHDYETARRMDTATSRAIETLRPGDIGYDDACGRVPVIGMLSSARRHGLRARTLDLRNSGDTAGPRDQVVGYGAYCFEDA